MNQLEERVAGYDTEFIKFEENVKTVAQAENLLDVSSEEIVKSLVVIGEEPLLCIVPGNRSVDFTKLTEMYGDTRLATPKEVKDVTGYEIGGVPPIADIKVLIDERIMEKRYVYGGGGNERTLLKISPEDILKINKETEVVDIAE